MVLIFVSFGIQKFTPQSAQGIAVYISNSPFVSWLGIFGLRGEAYLSGDHRARDRRPSGDWRVRPGPIGAERLDGDRHVPHHLVVFLLHARRRQMEPLDGPDRVESCWRVPVQRHRPALRLCCAVLGVPAQDVALPSFQIGHGARRFESPSSRLPLYAQVEDALVARISSGALPVGAQLPSEEELIREFNVSRTTIRATIQNLLRRGLVEIRRGRGLSWLRPGSSRSSPNLRASSKTCGFWAGFRPPACSAAKLSRVSPGRGQARGARGRDSDPDPARASLRRRAAFLRRDVSAGRPWPQGHDRRPREGADLHARWRRATTRRWSRPNMCWRPPRLSPLSRWRSRSRLAARSS